METIITKIMNKSNEFVSKICWYDSNIGLWTVRAFKLFVIDGLFCRILD